MRPIIPFSFFFFCFVFVYITVSLPLFLFLLLFFFFLGRTELYGVAHHWALKNLFFIKKYKLTYNPLALGGYLRFEDGVGF